MMVSSINKNAGNRSGETCDNRSTADLFSVMFPASLYALSNLWEEYNNYD